MVEDLPLPDVGGAARTVRTVLRAAMALGYDIDLVITGRRLPAIVPADDALLAGMGLVFVNAIRVGDRLIPRTFGAAARWLKARLGLRPRRAAGGVAHIGRFLSPAETRRIEHRFADIPVDALFIDTIFASAALDAFAPTVDRYLITHDIFCERTESFRANGLTVQPAIDRTMEIAMIGRFSAVIANNPRDARTVSGFLPSMPVEPILTVVAEDVEHAAGRSAMAVDPHRMLYLGSAAHHNVDGLLWFLDEVWPRVRANIRDARLDIVGTIGTAIAKDHPGVTVHGRVADLAPIAAACTFAVNPVRMGSGLKIKMVDYFRLGLACIVSPPGAQGFPPDNAPFVIADDAAAFAAATTAFLSDPALARRHADRAIGYAGPFNQSAANAALARLTRAVKVLPGRVSSPYDDTHIGFTHPGETVAVPETASD